MDPEPSRDAPADARPVRRGAAGAGRAYRAGIDQVDVLFVCTANVNRSPLAAGLLAVDLARRGIEARVASAGLMASGHPASPMAIAAAAPRGADLSRHRSRQLSRDDLAAGLVLTMERSQLRAALAIEPAAFPRAFTLRGFVARAARSGGRGVGEEVAAWLGRLNEGRSAFTELAVDDTDTVVDPLGGTAVDFDRTAAELEHLVGLLSELRWPSRPGAGPG